MFFSIFFFLSAQIIDLLATALENPVKQNEENTEQKVEVLVLKVTPLSDDSE